MRLTGFSSSITITDLISSSGAGRWKIRSAVSDVALQV